MWVQFLEYPPPKIWEGKKRPNLGAISDNFRLWSRMFPERIDISKIEKIKLDGLNLFSTRTCGAGPGRPHVGLLPALLVFQVFQPMSTIPQRHRRADEQTDMAILRSAYHRVVKRHNRPVRYYCIFKFGLATSKSAPEPRLYLDPKAAVVYKPPWTVLSHKLPQNF